MNMICEILKSDVVMATDMRRVAGFPRIDKLDAD